MKPHDAETPGKGVIIDFDFAAMDGSRLLFETAQQFLKRLDDIGLDRVTEAKYLAGRDYLDGLTAYFALVKTKKTPQKAARELAAAFAAALVRQVPESITVAFRNFVKALSDRGVRVVLATRANIEAVKPAFEPMLGESVVLHQEASPCYGGVNWDSWRRACVANGLSRPSTIAVTGSGHGVKSALVAGMGSIAVAREHVAYQDFGGADQVVTELSAPTARQVLEVLRV